ncbi:unnamed protein product [Rhizoctonia solani]|uniref:Uncharacterized protein n=1 Tax=Rhizoctonia solani TaxID=456999 RepID=A0A8H3CWK8_9AGAM|nr:unnamed protein product [Rhizoctonia solani]
MNNRVLTIAMYLVAPAPSSLDMLMQSGIKPLLRGACTIHQLPWHTYKMTRKYMLWYTCGYRFWSRRHGRHGRRDVRQASVGPVSRHLAAHLTPYHRGARIIPDDPVSPCDIGRKGICSTR